MIITLLKNEDNILYAYSYIEIQLMKIKVVVTSKIIIYSFIIV